MIEGLGQGIMGANWGDGVATAASVIAGTGVSDPNPFFRSLMTQPFLNKVIIAPHVYPPSISGLTVPALATAPGYYTRLSNSFGYLNKAGYCTNGSWYEDETYCEISRLVGCLSNHGKTVDCNAFCLCNAASAFPSSLASSAPACATAATAARSRAAWSWS